MKRCNVCLEECEYWADDVAELCEHCLNELLRNDSDSE